MSTENEDQNQDQQNNNDKVEKKYTAAMSKLVAVLGGKKQLKLPKAIPNDMVSTVVNDLFKEEHKLLVDQVKSDLRTVLKSFAEMEKEFKRAEQELQKVKTNKKKEFTTTVEALLAKVEDAGALERNYTAALKEATEAKEETPAA
jgi:hypothetical protein